MRSVVVAVLLSLVAACRTGPLTVEDRPATTPTTTTSSTALTITPATLALPLGGHATLTSSVPVTWSIGETGAPLTVDAAGNVQASSQRGVYHVVATATGAPAATETSVVTVGPTTLDVILGTPGGVGNADGAGGAVRFGGGTTQPVGVGIVGDGSGNLYVSDIRNNSIRKVVIATGAVTTIARNVPSPLSLVFEAPSTLYVLCGVTTTSGASPSEWQIEKLDLTTASLQPIGAPLSGPSWIAGDDHGHLYIAAPTFTGLLELDVASGAVTVAAGGNPTLTPANPTDESAWDGVGSAAVFGTPGPIAHTSGDDFIFFDQHNIGPRNTSTSFQWNVRHFNAATLAVTTTHSYPVTANDGMGRFPAVCGASLAIDLAGAIVDEQGTHIIWGSPSYSEQGRVPFVDIGDPYGLYCVSETEVYYVDVEGGMRIRAFDGSDLNTLAGGAPLDGRGLTGQLAYDASASRLWLLDSPTLAQIDPATATLVSTVTQPTALSFAFDAGGDAYFASWTQLTELAPLPAGLGATPLATASNASASILGLAVDGMGHAFVIDANTGNPQDPSPAGKVEMIDLADGTFTQLATVPGAQYLAYTGDSLIVLTDTTVSRVSLADHSVSELAGTAAGFVSLTSVAVDVDNRIAYLADLVDARVRALDLRNNALADVAGTSGRSGVLAGALPAGLNRPESVALAPNGDLFVSDQNEDVVLRIHN